VRYRLYKPEDFVALYAIEEVCFLPPHRFSRRYMRKLVQQPNAATWLAGDDRRMCGFAQVEWTKETAEVVAYIQTIEVLPDVRGEGVGGELLRRIENSASAAAAEAIWLHVYARNAGAIRLYVRHNYQLQGCEEDYYGVGRAALIYAKRLCAKQED
jgi:ribosomal protein S18 acetylase RimI-like enzyme